MYALQRKSKRLWRCITAPRFFVWWENIRMTKEILITRIKTYRDRPVFGKFDSIELDESFLELSFNTGWVKEMCRDYRVLLECAYNKCFWVLMATSFWLAFANTSGGIRCRCCLSDIGNLGCKWVMALMLCDQDGFKEILENYRCVVWMDKATGPCVWRCRQEATHIPSWRLLHLYCQALLPTASCNVYSIS